MQWSLLVNCRDEFEANLIIGMLEEEGITCQTKYRGAGEYIKIYFGVGKDVDIYVPESKLARAKELLAALEEAETEQ